MPTSCIFFANFVKVVISSGMPIPGIQFVCHRDTRTDIDTDMDT